MATCKVSLKLLVDKRNRTVLFAEAGKDFVDFLFHILILPVGQMIRHLAKTGTVGSLDNLYSSVENLSDVFIKSSKKDSILKPKAPVFLSEIPFLLLDIPSSSDSTPKTYYTCSNCRYNYFYVTENPSTKCPGCKVIMKTLCNHVKPPADNPAAAVATAAESDGNCGLVQGEVMYMVMDDLVVKPMSTVSSIALLNKFNMEIGHIEEKVVSLGMDEGVKLLRASFTSEKVLTDVFLNVRPKRERA